VPNPNAWVRSLRRWDPSRDAYAQRAIVVSDDLTVARGEVFLVDDSKVMDRLFNIGWISHSRFGDGVKPVSETVPAVTALKTAVKSRK